MKILFNLALIFLPFFSLKAQSGNAVKIYEHSTDAIVRIFTYHEDGSMHGQGSGVIIKKYGCVLTNYHVLGDATRIVAEHQGKYISLDSIIAIDPQKDILILQLATPLNSKEYIEIPNIRLGNSDKLKIGQRIYAIGSPMGFENTITEGIISGLRTSNDSTRSLIQISAPISSGSSGGAILNAKGELIGISTMVISGETVQNLNFALLINDVKATFENKSNTSIKTNDEALNAYYQKGYSEYKAKNYLTAIINYEKALQLSYTSQGTGLLMYYLGLAYYKLGDSEKAITIFNKSLEKIKSTDTYIALGTMYYEKSDFNKAIQNYELAIELNPGFYEGFLSLGVVYFQQNELNKSISALKRAIDINPKSYKPYFILGEISTIKNNYDVAQIFYEKSINCNPDYAEAYLSLSKLYLMKGENEKAFEYQQKAYQLKPMLRNNTKK